MMTINRQKNTRATYKATGVDTAKEELGMQKVAEWVHQTFSFCPSAPVKLPIGYFANVLQITPEIGIAIEGGVTRDAPGVHPEEAQELLGGGPAIFLYDSSALPNLKLVSLIKQTAKEKAIPLQPDLIQGYGDDSSEMQKSNGGAPTVNMVVPVRYTHSHNGIMNRGDFDKMVDLLVAVLQKLDAKTVANLRDFTPQ